MKTIKLKPIWFVKNYIKKPHFWNFVKEISEIVIDKKFTKALNSVEDYSHLIIVYWMDKIKGYAIEYRLQGNPAVPIVGIFACRCQ